MEKNFFKKKVSKFTMKEDVLNFNNHPVKLMDFEETGKDGYIAFALSSNSANIILAFKEVAKIKKEKHYFFQLTNDTIKESIGNGSVLFIIGRGFELKFRLKEGSVQSAKDLIISIIEKEIGQDLLFWDYERHATN